MSCFNGAWALLEDNLLGIAVVRQETEVAYVVLAFTFFTTTDRIRHWLVQLIVGGRGRSLLGIWVCRDYFGGLVLDSSVTR